MEASASLKEGLRWQSECSLPAEWRFWLRWVLASAVTVGGAGAALWPALWAVFGALACVVPGTAQWLILRKRVQRSRWWVLVSAVSWAVGWIAGARGELVPETVCGAVFALLHEAVFSDYGKVTELEDAPQTSLGALQPVFAPYVPQWRHSLALTSWVFRGGRHTFKVSLGRGLWRRLAIDTGEPLDVLAGAILDAYAFDHDHLYEFSYRNRFGVDESVHHPYMDEGPWTSEVRVGDVPLAVGQSMTYLFDFGDQWEFGVTLEQIEPAGEGPDRPAVLDGRGDAPEQYPSRDEGEW